MTRPPSEIKVFISSTFADMHSERDHLVKVVFPALRERLVPYDIELIDIDLRWGITKEQVENDQVLSLILEQIDTCRPFFIGLLGQRYGWIPNKFPVHTASKYGWLAHCSSKSITELEIAYGVLNNTAMHSRALFYFRLEAALSGIPGAIRDSVYIETDPIKKDKLELLKETIRKSKIPHIRSYNARWDDKAYNRSTRSNGKLVDLDNFGKMVFDDLWTAIQSEYGLPQQPKSMQNPDPIVQEQIAHERFARKQLHTYVDRIDITSRLRVFLEKSENKPIILCGTPGSGATSIIARLHSDFKQVTPEGFIISHFIGASPSSTNLRKTIERFCNILNVQFRFNEPLPADMFSLNNVFHKFLANVPKTQRLIFIIDGIDKFESADNPEELGWLPSRCHSNIKFILSCNLVTDSRLAKRIKALDLPIIEIGEMTDQERRELISTIPSVSAKSLDSTQIDMLLKNPATKNPLFLAVALEELRGFGSFELLNSRIAELPQPDVSSQNQSGAIELMFHQVIVRLCEEFDGKLVKYLLSLLACSRYGLSEIEIRELVKNVDGKNDLFPVLRQLRPYLIRRGHLVTFYYQSFKKAIYSTYLQPYKQEHGVHLILAEFFAKASDIDRQIEELPWQLATAGEWDRLAQTLTDFTIFVRLFTVDRFQLRRYWAEIEQKTPLKIVDYYQHVLNNPLSHTEHLFKLAIFMADMGHLDQAHICYGALAQFKLQKRDWLGYQQIIGNQAVVYKNQGNYVQALILLKEQEKICRAVNCKEGLATCLINLGNINKEKGNIPIAKECYREAKELSIDLQDPDLLSVIEGNIAGIDSDAGNLKQAIENYKEQERLCREQGDQDGLVDSLDGQAKIYESWGDYSRALSFYEEMEMICERSGNKRKYCQVLIGKASNFYGQGKKGEAITLYKQAEDICLDIGDNKTLSFILLNNAHILRDRGDLSLAEALLLQQEEICRQSHYVYGLQSCLEEHARILLDRGEYPDALLLLQEQEQICRRSEFKLELSSALGWQGNILLQLGDLDKAQRLFEEKQRICEASNYLPGVASSLNSKGLIAKSRADYKGALELHQKQEAICRQIGDMDGLQGSLGNQGTLYVLLENLQEALKLFNEAEQICRNLQNLDSLQRVLGNKGNVLSRLGESLEATRLYKEQENICRNSGYLEGLQASLINQALILADQNNFVNSLELLREAEKICRQTGNPASLAVVLINLALILHQSGSTRSEAIHYAQEAYNLCREHGLQALMDQIIPRMENILGHN